jgi:glycosyltransferase involved in cell wall biosynthesis
VPFAIQDGETGILIHVRDVEGLRRAVLQLRDDPALRKRMGDAARARAEREFSGRRMSEKYCRILFPDSGGRE